MVQIAETCLVSCDILAVIKQNGHNHVPYNNPGFFGLAHGSHFSTVFHHPFPLCVAPM